MSTPGIVAIVTLALLAGLMAVLRLGRGDEESSPGTQGPDGETTGGSAEEEASDRDPESSAVISGESYEASSEPDPGDSGEPAEGGAEETEVAADGPAVITRENQPIDADDEESGEDEEGERDGPSRAEEQTDEDEGDAEPEEAQEEEAPESDRESVHIAEPGGAAFDPETGDVVHEDPSESADSEADAGGGGPAEAAFDEVDIDESSGEANGGDATGDTHQGWTQGDEDDDEEGEVDDDEALWDLSDEILSGEGPAVDGDESSDESDRPESAADETGESDAESASDEDGEPGYGVVNPPDEAETSPSESSDAEGSVLGFEGPRSGESDDTSS